MGMSLTVRTILILGILKAALALLNRNAGAPEASPVAGGRRQRAELCLVEPNPGECRGAFPRFYFNDKLDQCDCFLYGGCGNEGLDSSWLTLKECTDSCVPSNMTQGPRCNQLPKQDIQTFLQPSISTAPDTSNISDTELLGMFGNTDNEEKEEEEEIQNREDKLNKEDSNNELDNEAAP